MNEDLHIEKAAHLADKPAAENLATGRAREFVAESLAKHDIKPQKSRNIITWKQAAAWGGMALAACIAVVVVILRPSSGEGGEMINPSVFGVPSLLNENVSIHADADSVVTSNSNSSDSLAIDTIVYQE